MKQEVISKKVFIRTLGCQMNARDSEFVMGTLLDNGFTKARSPEYADVVLFNSCSVRKHAEDRLFSNISDLKKLKEKKRNLIIGLMGCTAQNYKEDVLRRVPVVDLVCGPGNESDLPALIKNVMKNRCPVIATDKISKLKPELFPGYRDGSFKAYISIGEGCDNFCSYCIVPYVRGRERSRDAKDIVRETKELASRGFKEITLLGQNVNSYNGSCTFTQLLKKLNEIKGIERIRFMTSHPKDASVELFKAMRDMDKVCEHLHLPLQSGSDRILKLMNRKYSAADYLKLVRDYRKFVPEGSITTDIIVGFPSENERDFQKTTALIKKIKFDNAFTFNYSPRPPAKSSALKDDIPAQVKNNRLRALIDIQREISWKKNERLKGEISEILVDGCGKKKTSLVGRTRTNKVVVFQGNKGLVGKFVNVKIETIASYVLKGRIV